MSMARTEQAASLEISTLIGATFPMTFPFFHCHQLHEKRTNSCCLSGEVSVENLPESRRSHSKRLNELYIKCHR